MGLVLFGSIIGLVSAALCAIGGNITLAEAALIYWITGTTAPLLQIALIARHMPVRSPGKIPPFR